MRIDPDHLKLCISTSIWDLQASEVLGLVADRRSLGSGFHWWCCMRKHESNCPRWLSCSDLCRGDGDLSRKLREWVAGSVGGTAYARNTFLPDQIDWCNYQRSFTMINEIRIKDNVQKTFRLYYFILRLKLTSDAVKSTISNILDASSRNSWR